MNPTCVMIKGKKWEEIIIPTLINWSVSMVPPHQAVRKGLLAEIQQYLYLICHPLK